MGMRVTHPAALCASTLPCFAKEGGTALYTLISRSEGRVGDAQHRRGGCERSEPNNHSITNEETPCRN